MKKRNSIKNMGKREQGKDFRAFNRSKKSGKKIIIREYWEKL